MKIPTVYMMQHHATDSLREILFSTLFALLGLAQFAFPCVTAEREKCVIAKLDWITRFPPLIGCTREMQNRLKLHYVRSSNAVQMNNT